MQMNTRTFHAASVQDAIRQARRELGAEAMLLNSKRVPARRQGEEDQFAVKFAYTHAVPANSAQNGAVLADSAAASAYGLALRVHEPLQSSAAGLGGFEDKGHAPGSRPAGKSDGAENAPFRSGPRQEDRPAPVGDAAPGAASLSGVREAAAPDRTSISAEAELSSRQAREQAPPSSAASARGDDLAAESFEKLRDQMLSMRKDMLQLAGSVRRVSSASYRQKLASDSHRYLYDLLVEQDFHTDLIERILTAVGPASGSEPAEPAARAPKASAGKARASRSPRKRSSDTAESVTELGGARLFAALQDAIATHIDLMAEPGLRRKRGSPLVISLVGPPGAGKTTTLVKLAVRYSELSRFPLQIISMDNFRVGASEQLRAYAAVLGVGFDTLTTVPALERALREYSSKEIILIDTPGLGWRDFDAADELAAFLCGLDHKITHLVAPASMRPADFERLADLYEAFDYGSLIYTKLDETASIGQLVSESWRRKKPLAYFATGQRIPDDLELASRERICERILPSESLPAHFAA